MARNVPPCRLYLPWWILPVMCRLLRRAVLPMAAALRAVDAACEAFGIEILMEHIPGERNVIADALSRLGLRVLQLLAHLPVLAKIA